MITQADEYYKSRLPVYDTIAPQIFTDSEDSEKFRWTGALAWVTFFVTGTEFFDICELKKISQA